jgi:hypothetical protein
VSDRLELQRWIGVLALAVAVPLPFTGIASWPFVGVFLAVAAAMLAARRPLPPLPGWLENLLALVILVLVVFAGGLRYGVLRPIAQLAVLVAAVRLFGCHEPKRAWRALAILVVVGVAGIASSTHPSLALYLVLLLAIVVAGVGRLEILALSGRNPESREARSWPDPRTVAVTVGIAVLVAAPLFALFPRLRSPFAAAPFGGRSVSGFREGVVLRGLGEIKESRAPALTIRFPGASEVAPEWLRLVGATLQYYRGGLWARGRLNAEQLPVGRRGVVDVEPQPPGAPPETAEIDLLKASEVLVVPVGTFTLRPPEGVPVRRDPLGVLRIPRGLGDSLSYRVEFVPGRVSGPPPDAEDLRLPPDSGSIVALARKVTAGTKGATAAALSIETYLRTNYHYTLDLPFDAALREDPVKWFLFRGRQGHCEFFASAMVILLRALEIPARLQAGYAGGEPLGDGSFLVRESNAHAWVVGWTGGRWQVFDPTPAEGRPPIGAGFARVPWRMALERVEGWWDRWVLTFSLADQVDLVGGAIRFVQLNGTRIAALLAALAVAALALGVLRRALRSRPVGERGTGREGLSRGLRRVMEMAQARGLVPPGLTPREFGRALAARVPPSADRLRWLVERHELWRYAGMNPPRHAEVRGAVRDLVRALRDTGAAGDLASGR